MTRPFIHRLALCALSALLATACSNVDYVEIDPSQVVMKRRGEGLALRAKPMNRNGTYYPRLAVLWKTDDPSVATVDGAGQVTAVGPGHTLVTASAGGRSAQVDVEVRTVEKLRLTPDKIELMVDAPAFRPAVTPLDAHGHELHHRSIEMKSADEEVANVDGEQVWPVGVGHTVVTVRADDRSATLDVTVTGKAAGGKKHRRE